MKSRILTMVVSLLCLALMVGCSGDDGAAGPAGPAGSNGSTGSTGSTGADGADGPNLLVAYGDINFFVGNPQVFSFGPASVTVSVVENGTNVGDFTVTIDGTFPNSTGTLLVSTSSDDTVSDVVTTGTISTWTSTQIVIGILQYNGASGTGQSEDFSFALLGR